MDEPTFKIMEYTDEFLKKIINLGSLNYPLKKCLNVLEIKEENISKFSQDFKNSDSIIAKNYQIGIDLADFEIDCKLFQLAKTGELKAIKEFEERRKKYNRK